MSLLFKTFNEYCTRLYTNSPLKRVELQKILVDMNFRYYRPHHNRKSNPYCIGGLKLKDNINEIIDNLSKIEENSQVSSNNEFEEYVQFIKNTTLGALKSTNMKDVLGKYISVNK